MSRQRVQERVYKHMTDNPNVIQHASMIAEEHGYSVSSVSGALRRYSQQDGSGIRAVIGQRGAYLYSGPRDGSEDVKQMQVGDAAKCIGYSATGEPVIVTDDGVVYVAKPIR